MSVHDIFKSVSTIKVPIQKVSSISKRDNYNSQEKKVVLGNSMNNIGTTTTTHTNFLSFSNTIEHFDSSFVKIQNALDKSRQWKILRHQLYTPILVQFAKSNKFDLQRFEKR